MLRRGFAHARSVGIKIEKVDIAQFDSTANIHDKLVREAYCKYINSYSIPDTSSDLPMFTVQMRCTVVLIACFFVLVINPTFERCFAQERSVKPAPVAVSRIKLEKAKDRVVVKIDDQLFTEYVFKGYEKPILYPVIGPYGIGMTRNWPMKEGFKNEAEDHPHHKSIWFGHMKVNNESFWHVGKTAGTTRQTELVSAKGDTIQTRNKLVGKDGKTVIATDSRTIRFETDGDTRMIEFTVTYHATEGDIKFGDNKDGQMGIRMHPALRISDNKAVVKAVGKKVANGKAINSEGDTEKNIWGKRAKWIAYWGTVDEKKVGIAVFDHPSNLRHPTWWHARDYGLLSANPFGIHHFENKKEPVGEYTLKKGESLSFRHLFVFFPGDYQSAKIDERYGSWARSQRGVEPF